MRLENLARDAYAKGNYAEPQETSAIAYLKRVLAISPSDSYSKTLLENSVTGGKYQAQKAAQRKDFATAHRVANALAQLLPGRSDIAGLQSDIRTAEKGSAPHHAAPAADVSLRAYHLHADKGPGNRGPYCLGLLMVVDHHIKFTGESASEGEHPHFYDFACSDVRDIKKNLRVASHQGGFHVRTTSDNLNFVAEDSSLAHASALAAACSR